MFASPLEKTKELDQNEEMQSGDFQLELSADIAGTRTNEGIAHCIENEIQALEESRKFPEK